MLVASESTAIRTSMLDWLRKRRSAKDKPPEPEAEVAASQRSVVSAKSALLYKYLDGRFADAVVLTFKEIEDLLGFSLPEVARLSEGWWTDPDPDSRFSDSWILANRSARPNLRALTVAFDRVA
jgi:hypothetical protein